MGPAPAGGGGTPRPDHRGDPFGSSRWAACVYNTCWQRAYEAEQEQRSKAPSQRGEAEKQRALLRRLLYLSQINAADREWQKGDVQRAPEILNGQRPAPADPEDLRGLAWYHFRRFCLRQLLTFKGHAGLVASVPFSPDGKQLISPAATGLQVWDAATGPSALRLTGQQPAAGWSACFSPDGQRIASARADRTVKIWDALLGQPLLPLPGHAEEVPAVCFSPDLPLFSTRCAGLQKVRQPHEQDDFLLLGDLDRRHGPTVPSPI